MYQKKLKWKVNKSGCWICISHAKDKDRYVVFKRNKKWYRIHRYMYEQKYGKITKKDFIGHLCYNLNCINPKHLFKSDMKGIIKNSEVKNPNRKRGKLKKEEIIKIFKDRITPQKDLAEKYCVKRSAIFNIHKKLTWKNVTNGLNEEKYINARKRYWENRKKKWKESYKKKTKLKRREYDKNYEKKRKKTDREYATKKRLRQRVSDAFRYYINTGKIRKSNEYGIDYKEIIEHLKPVLDKLLPKDLKNYDLHHKKPLFTFNFVNKDGTINLKEVKRAWTPKNIILITKKEHKKIHRKLNQKRKK